MKNIHRYCIKNDEEYNYKTASEGFVTDKDEFVDRKKVAEIAYECSQIKISVID